jgi:alanyl-tRNA synthetase
LNGIPLAGLRDVDGQIEHLLTSPWPADETTAHGLIDWNRRFDHMQQHTGQHLLSAVIAAHTGLATLSVHLGAEVSTIDLDTPSLAPERAVELELLANQAIAEDRPVRVTFEDAAAAHGLRKASERSGTLRIVEIEGLDRSACGGTHVRRTGQIGSIAIRKIDKVRGQVRLEFVCGLRAVRRARADQDSLTQVARLFSVGLDQAAASAQNAVARLADAEKALRKLEAEAAGQRGRELYAATAADALGRRIAIHRVAQLDDAARQFAAGFTAQPDAVLTLIGQDPPAVLLAASVKSLHCGNILKQALEGTGGRGGGGATLAQASVPSPEEVAGRIRDLLQAAE